MIQIIVTSEREQDAEEWIRTPERVDHSRGRLLLLSTISSSQYNVSLEQKSLCISWRIHIRWPDGFSGLLKSALEDFYWEAQSVEPIYCYSAICLSLSLTWLYSGASISIFCVTAWKDCHQLHFDLTANAYSTSNEIYLIIKFIHSFIHSISIMPL